MSNEHWLSTIKQPDLKPCPFCGAPAKVLGSNMIACTGRDCGAELDYGHWTGPIDPVAEAWNRRVLDDE